MQLDLSTFFLGCTHFPGATACSRQQTGNSSDRNWSFDTVGNFKSQQQQVCSHSIHNLVISFNLTDATLDHLFQNPGWREVKYDSMTVFMRFMEMSEQVLDVNICVVVLN